MAFRYIPHMLRLVATVALVVPATLTAQQPEGWDPGRMQVTRDDLLQLLQRLDQAAGGATYSQPVRDRARATASGIRTRLAEGDFQVGDRIRLSVEGEPTLSDTFTVRDGRVLRLPAVGDISLAGVLRSELEAHVQTALSKFLRDPVVRARSLIRLSLLGQLVRPGFYVVPTDMVLTDALMLAGGPGPTAKLEGIRVEREGQPIWEDAELQQALAEGRTVDQLSLRAGDQVIVPRKTGIFTEPTLRTVSILLSIPVALYGLIRLIP